MTNIIKGLLLSILCVAVLAQPATAKSGFVSKNGRLTPGLKVEDPKEKIIIIHNHGRNAEFERDECSPEEIDYIWLGGVPSIIANLSGEKISGKTVRVYALCADTFTGDYTRWSSTVPVPYPGVSKQEKRQKVILETVEKFLALSVPPRQVFLSGYSAGAWASIALAATAGEKLNAAVALGPAFAYKWWPRDEGWKALRTKQVELIRSAKDVNALVFSHPDDPYETPETLSFLKEFKGVEFIAMPSYPKKLNGQWCRYADNPDVLMRDGHDIYQATCFHTYAPRIREFIERRLKEVDNK